MFLAFKFSRAYSTLAMLDQQPISVWTQHSNSNYNPLRTWILQLVLIMTLTQILYQLLKRSRQPRVIAEILAGILLSPSALGRIPGFTETFFPEISIPYLSLIAEIGLILFLFLVGLEIDGSLIRKNVSLSASIALGGIILPFGLGSALSVPLYNYFVNSDVEFTHFFLFIGIAFSITAFPVLCRILTELKLLDTTVGVVVLSVGVLNDIFGWILLALSLTLARSSSSISALWILLYAVVWVLFLFYPVRRAFFWLAHWTGSVNNGPSIIFITISILTMFCSAFFTDLIGVHAIFGAFLVGLIIPREGGLAISLTEKLEDMVSIIFLPLYFTASGLSTDFGLLNNEVTWIFTLAIIILAWIGKFGGGVLAARASGFQWQEAASIGTLLSCKGLIELIVLNVGLSAGIINKTVFSMFVLEALTLTFLTTPVVMTIYPPEYRKKASRRISMTSEDAERTIARPCAFDVRQKSLITVVLDRFDGLPSVMSFMELLNHRAFSNEPNTPGINSRQSNSTGSSGLCVKALRLIELSGRSSDVMKSSAIEELLVTDPLLKIFKAFCGTNDIDISASLSIIPLEGFASKVAESTSGHPSELVLIPCPGFHLHRSGEASSKPQIGIDNPDHHATLIGSSLHFLQEILSKCITDSVILFERGTEPIDYRYGYHFIFPFFGGKHDRLALRLILQLCAKNGTTATVIQVSPSRVTWNKPTNTQMIDSSDAADHGLNFSQPGSSPNFNLNPEQKIDDDLWRELTGDVGTQMQDALQRIEFEKEATTHFLTDVILRMHLEIGKTLTERSKRPYIMLGHESLRNEQRSGFSDSEESSQGAWRDTATKVSPDVVTTLGVLPSAILAKTDERVGLMIVRSGYSTVV